MARKKTNSNIQEFKSKDGDIVLKYRDWDGGSGNLIGFGTIELYDGEITIYNCKVFKKNKGGAFLAMPQHQGTDGQYYNTAYITKDSDLSNQIEQIMSDYFKNV